MAKKRFTDIEIWNKEWFMDLTPKLKCLVRYLFDNCDSSGVWSPNWKLASLQIGENVSLHDLSYIPETQYEVLKGGKIFLPDFISFQYGRLSEASPAHKPVFRDIEKNKLSNRVFNRVSKTLQEKEEDKEKEMEEEKDFGKSENLLIPEMLSTFKKCFPKYPTDESTDFPSLRDLAGKIKTEQGWKGGIEHNTQGILKRWGEMVSHIKTDSHLSKYSLSQVNRHFQSIIQSLTNGTPTNQNPSRTNEAKPGTSQARTEALKKW